jgi:predicted RecA/RadA family phage recombinase
VWADFSTPSGATATVTPAAGDKILGICARQVTTTAAGDLVDIYTSGIFAIKGMSSIDNTDIGGFAIMDVSAAVTDNPADCVSTVDATEAANDCMLGKIVSYYDSTAYVELGPGVTGWIYNATSADWEY